MGKLNLRSTSPRRPVCGLRMRNRGLHVDGDDVGVMVSLVADRGIAVIFLA